jgi:hypothetical protein
MPRSSSSRDIWRAWRRTFSSDLKTAHFPVPVYAIGLRKAWIFSEPFETWPIQLSGSAPWKVEQDSASVAESLALLRELLPLAFDGHDQPPK